MRPTHSHTHTHTHTHTHIRECIYSRRQRDTNSTNNNNNNNNNSSNINNSNDGNDASPNKEKGRAHFDWPSHRRGRTEFYYHFFFNVICLLIGVVLASIGYSVGWGLFSSFFFFKFFTFRLGLASIEVSVLFIDFGGHSITDHTHTHTHTEPHTETHSGRGAPDSQHRRPRATTTNNSNNSNNQQQQTTTRSRAR